MYDICPKTGEPVGIVNDFDLASWVDHPTSNKDRTGTIPFMAIDLLDGGLDCCIPRLYRHDIESFCWVLAYVTVADIEYKNHTIKIFPLSGVDTWFRDGDKRDRDAHISSKRHFHSEYGQDQEVSGRYDHYFNTVQQITRYWSDFHKSLRSKNRRTRPPRPNPRPVRGELVLSEPEADDPAGSLNLLITTVEKLSGENSAREGFAAVKAHLLEAIATPTVLTAGTLNVTSTLV